MRSVIKRIFLFGVALSILTGLAFAQGIYIEQNISNSDQTSSGAPSLVKMWIDKNIMRLDELQTTIIIDQKTWKAVSINHDTKSYYEESFKEEDLDQAFDTDIKELKKAYQKTGQTKKIGAWNCYEVKHRPTAPEGEETESTIWYSEDLGVNWYEIFMIGLEGLSQKIKKYAEKDKTILEMIPKGFPVWKSTTTKKGGKTSTQEIRLLKFERGPITSDQFRVPAAYKKSEKPLVKP